MRASLKSPQARLFPAESGTCYAAPIDTGRRLRRYRSEGESSDSRVAIRAPES